MFSKRFAVASAAIATLCLTAGLAPASAAIAAAGDCPNSASVRPVSTRSGPATVVDIAASNSNFSTLVAAVEAAGLLPVLTGPGPFTVFAPTNDAFAKLPAGTVERLLRPENRAELVAVLSYHVVPGRVTSDQLVGRTLRAETVQGSRIAVDGRTGVRVNGSTVIQADLRAGNGVVHVIDTVLLPPPRH